MVTGIIPDYEELSTLVLFSLYIYFIEKVIEKFLQKKSVL